MAYRLLIAAAFTLLLAVSALGRVAFGATPESAPHLRNTIFVDADEITFGDIFEGAGKAAKTDFAPAPAPGETLRFSVDQLQGAARAVGLNWEPDPGLRVVSVTRGGKLVPHKEIIDQITKALIDYSGDRNISVQLANPLLTLAVAHDAPATVRVDDIDYDPRSERFTVMLAAPADDPEATRVQVLGRALRMAHIPVLRDRFGPDHVISRNDIAWLDVPMERVDRNTITDANDLIGKSPKRGLSAETQIRIGDVDRPILVAKGALITMTVSAPNMTLTATGRAVDEGGKGDMIQVQNIQSHKTVVAMVVGHNLVAVGASQVALGVPARADLP